MAAIIGAGVMIVITLSKERGPTIACRPRALPIEAFDRRRLEPDPNLKGNNRIGQVSTLTS